MILEVFLIFVDKWFHVGACLVYGTVIINAKSRNFSRTSYSVTSLTTGYPVKSNGNAPLSSDVPNHYDSD